jgi:hypothetical protein
MGSWGVIAQSRAGDYHNAEIICEMNGTKDQALEALSTVVHTYLPRDTGWFIEKWRRVYRLAGGESYFVLIKGKATLWNCTLQVAELVSDSKRPDMT